MDVIASKTYSLARLHTETECGQEWKSALYSFSPSTLRERKKFYDRLIIVNSAQKSIIILIGSHGQMVTISAFQTQDASRGSEFDSRWEQKAPGRFRDHFFCFFALFHCPLALLHCMRKQKEDLLQIGRPVW